MKDNMDMKGLPKLGTGKEFTGVSKKLSKGKGQNAMKPSKAKGLPRVTKGRWSEEVESFNHPSGAERQSPNYRGKYWG